VHLAQKFYRKKAKAWAPSAYGPSAHPSTVLKIIMSRFAWEALDDKDKSVWQNHHHIIHSPKHQLSTHHAWSCTIAAVCRRHGTLNGPAIVAEPWWPCLLRRQLCSPVRNSSVKHSTSSKSLPKKAAHEFAWKRERERETMKGLLKGYDRAAPLTDSKKCVAAYERQTGCLRRHKVCYLTHTHPGKHAPHEHQNNVWYASLPHASESHHLNPRLQS